LRRLAGACRSTPTLCRTEMKQVSVAASELRGCGCTASPVGLFPPRGCGRSAPSRHPLLEAVSTGRVEEHRRCARLLVQTKWATSPLETVPTDAVMSIVGEQGGSCEPQGADSRRAPCGSRRLPESSGEFCSTVAPSKLPHNMSVDTDTLRQGATRRLWKSCTVRPLAATCRSPLR
jgi:hypothetical protein